jgi:K+-sensing histidine kinase KdpD
MSGLAYIVKAASGHKRAFRRGLGQFHVALLTPLPRGASLAQKKPDQAARLWHLAVLWVLGSLALAFVTWVCFGFRLNFATTVSAFLIVIVLLSLMDSFISSAIFSVIAVGCLDYFFVEPIFTFEVADPQNLTALARISHTI